MADINQTIKLIDVSAKHLELPNGTVTLKVSSKEIDPSTLARIMEPVFSYLNDYRKLAIRPSIEKYDKQLEGMTDAKAAKELAKNVNDELKKLVGNLEKEAQRQIDTSWSKIKKENKAYTKFKLKIGAKVTWGVVKIGKSISALVATSGAKADEYVKIAKSVIGIAKELKTAFASEEKVREQVRSALEDLAKNKKAGKVGKSHIKKVEDSVKLYGNKLTPIRKKAEDMAKKLNKLLELGDKVDITAKQRGQIDKMINQVIDFNKTEQDGRAFMKAALKVAADVEGKIDLSTVKGYASKLKTAFDAAKKVIEVAADIL